VTPHLAEIGAALAAAIDQAEAVIVQQPQLVIAIAAISLVAGIQRDPVAALVSVEPGGVGAGAAADHVGAATAFDDIGTVTAIEVIVAGEPPDPVRSELPIDRVTAGRAIED